MSGTMLICLESDVKVFNFAFKEVEAKAKVEHTRVGLEHTRAFSSRGLDRSLNIPGARFVCSMVRLRGSAFGSMAFEQKAEHTMGCDLRDPL